MQALRCAVHTRAAEEMVYCSKPHSSGMDSGMDSGCPADVPWQPLRIWPRCTGSMLTLLAACPASAAGRIMPATAAKQIPLKQLAGVGGALPGMRPSLLVREAATVSHVLLLPGAWRCSLMATSAAGRPRQVSNTWVVMGDRAPSAPWQAKLAAC
jgi:hypothetical protein